MYVEQYIIIVSSNISAKTLYINLLIGITHPKKRFYIIQFNGYWTNIVSYYIVTNLSK